MGDKIRYYFKIWFVMSRAVVLEMMNKKAVFLIFFTAKIIRFGLFFGFIYFILAGTKTLAGYDLKQTLFFFITFSLVDVIAQFLFREVYRFRPQVVSGDFDLTLTKPMSALFRSLMGGADVIDLVTIPPLVGVVIWMGMKFEPSFGQSVAYVALVINSLVVAAAFHILVLALGIVTFEIDHTIMIYRDLTAMGKFPIEIYREPVRGLLTYLVPIGIMIAMPAKMVMGLTSVGGVVVSFVVGAVLMYVALRFWKFALRYYTSASS